MNIKQYINDLHLPYRGNCPNCSGTNTFVANNSNGYILYYCFRASCSLRGKINYEISVDDLRNNDSNNIIRPMEKVGESWGTPSYFVSPLSSPICYKFLNRYGLIDFYSKHVNLIRYDPKQNRCVFILLHKGECYGAVGRSLDVSSNSRWFVYHRSIGCPFQVHDKASDTSVLLVEDCVSACVASSCFNSVGLLGTNVSSDTIKYILPYTKVYIALDDDATNKAIKLQKQLSYYRPSFIVPLRKDIKYYSTFELEELKKELL